MKRSVPTFALLVPLLLGCGEDDEPKTDLAGELPRYPVPGCESLDHSPCDVSQSACQSTLLEMAACLRGDAPGELPAFDVIGKEEYARRVAEGLDATPRPDPDHEEAAFALLKLIPADGFGTEALVRAASDFVGGFYDSDTKRVTLVDGGLGLSERAWSALLVHEFIHVLQDRELTLSDWRERADSEDAWLALRAIVEGEAELHQLRYYASVSGFDPAHAAFDAYFASRVARGETELLQSNSAYLLAPYRFPYDWGGRYLQHVWQSGGHGAIDARFAELPTTTHALMASQTEVYVPAFEPTTPEAPAAPNEWALAVEHQLGALVTFLAVGRRVPDVTRARELALAWRGDRLFVYGKGGDTALVWRIDFADETSAASAVSAWGSYARAVGSRVTIAIAGGNVGIDWAF